MKAQLNFDPSHRPVYAHLEPIVELLLKHGNSLAREYRWGENRTGFYCFLAKAIDFALIERTFDLPAFVRLIETATPSNAKQRGRPSRAAWGRNDI